MKINWEVLFFSFVIVFLVAFIGSSFTTSGINSSWYQSIKPNIAPPNYIFPIVWNILFFLIALSLYFVWIKGELRMRIVIVFGLNFLLNILWSYLFFSLRLPLFAFIELIFLWLSILLMIFVSWNINETSGYLLVPYLFWVSFAAVLNFLSI